MQGARVFRQIRAQAAKGSLNIGCGAAVAAAAVSGVEPLDGAVIKGNLGGSTFSITSVDAFATCLDIDGDGVKDLSVFIKNATFLVGDSIKQEERWRAPFKQVANGGTLATGGNLVFQGNSSGYFAAYRATDGEELWEVPVGTATIASPIT